MNAADIVGMMIPVSYFMMLAIEAIWPAREFPKIRRWRLIGFGFLAVIMGLGAVTPLLIPLDWLAKHRLLDGTRLGVVGGTIVGLLFSELVGYGIHRAAHRFSFMWRSMHQMHHAPQRIDLAGSTVFHPTEVMVQNVLGMGIGILVMGLDPLAVAILGFLNAFLGMFQHLNVKTPQWLGYFIQRPEAHCIHHQLNVHAYNYGNITLWDMVFGTFRNPATFEGRVGFAEKPSYLKMLLGKDVSGGLGDGVYRRRNSAVGSSEVMA
jgi:sterol desaturase/sphingolipid hydroxylase (fatty acid hydroxylase superfamily)